MLHFNKERGATRVTANTSVLRDRVEFRRSLVRSLIPAGAYRKEMVRRWVIEKSELEGITIGLAGTLAEREQAFRLVHESYVARGIALPARSGLMFSPHHILPGTTTFIAMRSGRLIGTISLVEDSPVVGRWDAPVRHVDRITQLPRME